MTLTCTRCGKARRSPARPPHRLRRARQGPGPGGHLRRLLEGLGGDRDQGHQRVPPELHGPPAPGDAQAGHARLPVRPEEPEPARMIHVEGLTKRYGDRVLLEDVSWHVKKKDRIGLSGPNGSGKTTLLRMLAGLEEPDAGRIRMASDTTIGYLPQDGIVHQGKTVHEEVVMAFAPLLALKEEQHRIEDAARPRRRRRRPRAPPHPLRRGDRALQGPGRIRDRGQRRRRAEGPRLLPGRPAAPVRGVLGRLADAHRPGQAPPRPAQPAADGRAHEPPRPARAQLAGGVPRRLPGLGGPGLPRPLLPRRHGEAHHRGGPAHPHRLPRQLLASTWSTTRRPWSGCASRTAGRARRSRRPRPSSAASATRPPRPARCRAGSSSSTRSSASRSRPSARRSASSSPTRPKPGRVVLELKGVRKSYGDKAVLDGIDLLIERGDRIALVGPNGAGKSTLMRILAAVDQPDSGARRRGTSRRHRLLRPGPGRGPRTRATPSTRR